MPFSIIAAALVMVLTLSSVRLLGAVDACLRGAAAPATQHRAAWIAVLFGVKATIVWWVGRGQPLAAPSDLFGSLWVLYSFQYHAIEQPLKSWLAHLVFYGPVAVLILWRWGRLAVAARRLGFGAGALISLALVAVLSVDAESRYLQAFLPWLTLFAIASLGRVGPWFGAAFIALSLVATRWWGQYGATTPGDDPWLMTWRPWWSVAGYLRASRRRRGPGGAAGSAAPRSGGTVP